MNNLWAVIRHYSNQEDEDEIQLLHLFRDKNQAVEKFSDLSREYINLLGDDCKDCICYYASDLCHDITICGNHTSNGRSHMYKLLLNEREIE